jgi:site-specific recombinase XerD
VRHALLRAGIDAPTTGAHQFRHGLATEMLRHGGSLDEIGELLGHRSPETTKIYTKVARRFRRRGCYRTDLGGLSHTSTRTKRSRLCCAQR